MSKNPATIGGDFTEGLTTVRQNGRLYHTPSFSDDGIGFRLVHDDADRVARGGGWNSYPEDARVANRGRSTPSGRYTYLGLRLVREEA